MSVRIGIMGVNGYGGSELLRLCAAHPTFEVKRVYGESSAGQSLRQRFPSLTGLPLGDLTIERFSPNEVDDLDLLFASLPTGQSKGILAEVPERVRVLDIGGDHRFVEGWVYGLTELPGAREKIKGANRVANPGCYPAATILALAPLIATGLVEPEGIVVDAKSGVSGAGRGGSSDFGYADTNEDLHPYGLLTHPHVPEMTTALSGLAGGKRVSLAFVPHLTPMTRGLLSTCYGRPAGNTTTAQLMEAARTFYEGEPFIKVVDHQNGRGVHTKWAVGSNFVFVSYAVNAETGLIIATGAEDNLGKGAAGQAIQNANLMTGQPETAGLGGLPVVP
jgi:N-acetyl-gamma-glutamyl-phosphate reductase